jgi:peptidoglycan/LPS O-acetylase OafA/YrhL
LGLFIGSYPSGRSSEGTVYALIHFVNLDTLPMMYHVLGAFLVIMVLLESKRLQEFFSNKYFLLLGELSFAMYLLHFIVLGSLASFIFLKVAPFVSYAGAFFASLITSIVVVFVSSWLMHLTVDKYTFDFSQFVYEKVFQRILALRFPWHKK